MQTGKKKRSENETAANWIAGTFGLSPLWVLVALVILILFLESPDPLINALGRKGKGNIVDEVKTVLAGNQGYLYRLSRIKGGGSGWRSR